MKKRLAVLISGNGSNLQALLDASFTQGEIILVVSNKRNAYGLQRAEKKGVETFIPDKENYDVSLYEKLMNAKLDGIVLAGYLKIIDKKLIGAFENRMINIHPSLIPSFCGRGFYGERVAQAVLEYGVRYTGVTTHFATELADEGPIIFQEVVAVNPDDTVETLSKRVLEIEHQIIVKSVEYFCNDALEVQGRHVLIGA
ncbi:phosphoribosylglycinamide formyltransferase [Erysipelothrix aquatica]|uniref:phosphoribosylglycinamide formyltransferase n=1 Tax=Erysipelothrix aquatica TaxID=2683714 RepID=UPI00135A252E|nr:phosphoribosylglycinamide formyltransferase [Erysipelothrix aquatica]